MINWLGQEIKVGDIVYRGARDGDSSSFKLGTVIKVNPEKETARVEWNVEQQKRIRDDRKSYDTYAVMFKYESVGTCSIHTLFLCPGNFIDDLPIREGWR
ncbi:hypothetical protein SEA_WEASELS2_136 [Rhodococcus phage Weasels2]|uniref:Uncharacterized protein n=1 Tax=Rhodococcus phage Weasels2 TaxID=1897437 RepID=A0A1I9SAB5_9CAUD|nr:hypothetical protein FDH04_gp273 [Rhodococcus phage Weasels2]AOZ63721.1 hypothetical protein SEA_WEASELS2_136 [Rhodococcus phage Weasels2]